MHNYLTASTKMIITTTRSQYLPLILTEENYQIQKCMMKFHKDQEFQKYQEFQKLT